MTSIYLPTTLIRNVTDSPSKSSQAKSANVVSNENLDAYELLNEIRIRNLSNIIIGLLNVNSICDKYDGIKLLIPGNVDIMILVETKLDNSYPTSQFKIDGFSEPFRFDRNKIGGGILIYTREDIPCKQLHKHSFAKDIEGLFLELNLRKSKWLLFGTYHPPSQNDDYFFKSVADALHIYNNSYEKVILAGDFNAEVCEKVFDCFLGTFGLNSLIKDNTSFKSLINPSCIDLLLTNNKSLFNTSSVILTGLSDFHKMVVTVMEINFSKSKPREIRDRNYKTFDHISFKKELLRECNENVKINQNYSLFQEIFLKVLNRHAPEKKKVIRSNEVPYMTKTLRKAIMTRSRLEHKYQKTRSINDYESFKKQKNYCNRLY